MAKKSAVPQKRPHGRPKRMVKVGSVTATVPSVSSLLAVGQHGVQLTQDQEDRITGFTDDHRRQLMLHAFARTGTVSGACELLRDPTTNRPLLAPHLHNDWLRNDPEYREIFEELEAAVSAKWEHVLFDKALNGLRETTTDADGNVRSVRIREDSSLLSRVVAARLPEYREEKNNGTQIAIVIQQAHE